MPTDPWGGVPDELRGLSAPRERLHDLVEAVYAVVSDLDVAVVLSQLTAAATRLVNADFGALGLLDPDGGPGDRALAEFIQVGMDADTVAAMPGWPRGAGCWEWC
ncbi:hypothetical protein ACWDOP_35295 [Nocardia sp. NPDC003693]